MRHGIAETVLVIGCLLLAIGSLMLVSTSHAADLDCETTGSTSCNARATCLENNKHTVCNSDF